MIIGRGDPIRQGGLLIDIPPMFREGSKIAGKYLEARYLHEQLTAIEPQIDADISLEQIVRSIVVSPYDSNYQWVV